MTKQDIGWAVDQMKAGARVRRAGWNGKGMWIALSPGMVDCPSERIFSAQNRRHADENGGKATILPCITMKTMLGPILPGWLASQTDLLSEDWELAE